MDRKIKIDCAAIKYGDQIFDGPSHADCMMKMLAAEIYDDNYEEGFLTSERKFVSREEAAEIAFKSGQIKEKVYSLKSYMIYSYATR